MTVSRTPMLLAVAALAALAVCVGPAVSGSTQLQPDALQPGDILVVDPDASPASTGVLFHVDPLTGARTVLSSFGAGSPSAVAIEADGDILVTDTAAGTDPNGGTSEWGVLYRLSRDPVTGDLIRTVLTDFGVGADTGRNPRAVAVEADGQILVTTGLPGTLNDKPLLVRVDPVSGARAIVSDFRDSSQGVLGLEPRGIAIDAGGAILVIDAQGGPSALGELVRINPQTGFRTSVSRFNTPVFGTTPTSVAVEATGQILVTDEGHLTTPLGLLFRIDPQSGVRTVLSDFNTGANTGREPAGVAIEADGQILVVDRHAGNPGAPQSGLLFRIDPQTGARTIVSDFAVGPNSGSEPLALAVVQPTQGELIVVNEIVNDNGGTAVVSDWTTIVTAGNPLPASFPGAGPPGTMVTLDPGAYGVAANGPAGYTVSLSPGCTGTIAAREEKLCTVTLDDQPGRLFVITNVVNDNGGTATASDWTVAVTGANASPATFPGAGAPGTTVTLDAGAYTVSANDPDGYTSTLSADCAGTIAVGETRTCTITKDDEPATLVVIAEVVNDNGGTLVLSEVTFHLALTGARNASPRDFPLEGAPGTTVTLDPGSYTFLLSGFISGWSATNSPDCEGTIAAGETKTCTLVFDDIPATLSVIEEVVNDDGSSAVPGDFTVTVTGGDPSPASFAGQGVPGTSVTLDAGSYSVDVSGPSGYTSTLSHDCASAIGLAETKTCTITSDDAPPAVPTCDGKVATIVGGAGPTDIRGTSGDDVIVDLDGDNIVRGRGGSDTICTGAGNDQIIAGDGADMIIDSGGQNIVQAGAGDDSVRTGSAADTINAGAGADRIVDTGGDNRVEGGTGNDSLTTGGGADTVNAGAGNDIVAAGDGNNTVNGQGGNDTITTGAGNDLIDGGVGFDTCSPGSGVNQIRRCEA